MSKYLSIKQLNFKSSDPYNFTADDRWNTPWPPRWTIHYYYDNSCLECQFFDTEEEAQKVLESLDNDGVPARLYDPEYILDSILTNWVEDGLEIDEEPDHLYEYLKAKRI